MHCTFVKLNKPFLAFIFLLLSNAGYAQDKNDIFDYGSIKDGKYTNSFFNLEINVPADWAMQNKDQIEEISERGKELFIGDDENMKAVYKASEVNIANLLIAFKYEVGAAVDYNPNFSMTVENIKLAPGIKNGSDYLFQARRFLEKSQIKYSSIDKKVKRETINGTEFYKMNTKITYLGNNITQTYYCTIHKGFSILIIYSYTDKKQEKELRQILSTLQIKK